MTYSQFPDLSPGDVFTATHTDLIRSNFDDHEARLAVSEKGANSPYFAVDVRRWVTLNLPNVSVTFSDAVVVFDNGAATFAGPAWDATNKWTYTTPTSGTSATRFLQWTSRWGPTTQLLPIYTFAAAHVDTTQTNHRYGLGDTTMGNAEPNNGLYFRSLNGNWFAVARASSTETGTAFDTGIAASTTPKEFRIVVNSTSSVDFFVDGTLVKNHTSNIPATTVQLFARGSFATNDATTRTARWSEYAGLSAEVRSS